MADEQDAAPAAAPKKKGGSKLKLIVAVVVLLAVGGGAAWWMTRGGAAAAEPVEPGPETRGLVTFEPFLVNLADGGGTRFLKVNLQLVLETKADATEIEETPVVLSQLRSDILEVLTEQHATELVTPEGKEKLKEMLKEHANTVLREEKVIHVLFTEFVVQF
ncbi:MAG: flagellar basal body-associated FliL family protein [Vicinamibacterales bacterium]